MSKVPSYFELFVSKWGRDVMQINIGYGYLRWHGGVHRGVLVLRVGVILLKCVLKDAVTVGDHQKAE